MSEKVIVTSAGPRLNELFERNVKKLRGCHRKVLEIEGLIDKGEINEAKIKIAEYIQKHGRSSEY